MIRHSRADAFRTAWEKSTDAAGRWSDIADDPNDPAAVAGRTRTLQAAWRPEIGDRISFLEQRCRGKHVLDIGCVAHDVERLSGADWLHARIATAAKSCVGVDILEEGVEAVKAAGFDAVVHDLSTGLGPLAKRTPFDVIVAGELLEHVPDLDMVFRVAADALSASGQLILTTPNPYAPHRVRAGQLGVVWENVDHIMYAFPSGIAELASRRGLVLTEATTVVDAAAPSASIARRLKRTIRGSHWRNVGYSDKTSGSQVAVDGGTAGRWLRRLLRRDQRFLGETSVYVVTRAAAAAPGGPTVTTP